MMEAWFNISNWFCKFSVIAILLIAVNSVVGDFIFRVQYSFPKVTETTNQKILYQKDPTQEDISSARLISVYGDKGKYLLEPKAKYSISGLVVAKNSNFWFRDVMRTPFDDVCLIDFGIVWGDLAADKKVLHRNMKFKSHKTLGQARSLEWRTKSSYVPWSFEYAASHLSHTHMIPANRNVMGGLLKIKNNDYVKLEGYLVDIYNSYMQPVAKTSLSRFDTNASSRGSGACEDMYVKSVQIGNKIYR